MSLISCSVGDWQITQEFFLPLEELYGPHTIDCFANFYTAKLPRFFSRLDISHGKSFASVCKTVIAREIVMNYALIKFLIITRVNVFAICIVIKMFLPNLKYKVEE